MVLKLLLDNPDKKEVPKLDTFSPLLNICAGVNVLLPENVLAPLSNGTVAPDVPTVGIVATTALSCAAVSTCPWMNDGI